MTDHSGEFLKCDTPTCDHFEMCPITAENVGKACQKCGANLLTNEDFVNFRTIQASLDAQNELVLLANPDAPTVLMATHVHGPSVARKVLPDTFQGNPFPNGAPA
jgi:hypothetical protein